MVGGSLQMTDNLLLEEEIKLQKQKDTVKDPVSFQIMHPAKQGTS